MLLICSMYEAVLADRTGCWSYIHFIKSYLLNKEKIQHNLSPSLFLLIIMITFFFLDHAVWHTGSQFLEQGLNLPSLQWNPWNSNHWITREVPLLIFILFIFSFCCAGSSLLHGLFNFGEQRLLYNGGAQAYHCGGYSVGSRTHGLQQLQDLGSIVVSHKVNCSKARGISPNQGPNPCLLRWQVDSLSLSHEGSPPSTTYY